MIDITQVWPADQLLLGQHLVFLGVAYLWRLKLSRLRLLPARYLRADVLCGADLAGFVLIAIGGPPIVFSFMHLSNLFPSRKATIITIFNVMLDASRSAAKPLTCHVTSVSFSAGLALIC